MGQSFGCECTGSREKVDGNIVDQARSLQYATFPKLSASRSIGKKCITVGTFDLAYSRCDENYREQGCVQNEMCGGRSIPKVTNESNIFLRQFQNLRADILCLQGLGEGTSDAKKPIEQMKDFLLQQGYSCAPSWDAIPACGKANDINEYTMIPSSQCVLFNKTQFQLEDSRTIELTHGATSKEASWYGWHKPVAQLVKLRPLFSNNGIDDEAIIIVNLVLRPPGGAIDTSHSVTGHVKIALDKILNEVANFARLPEKNILSEEVPVFMCGGCGFSAGSGGYKYLLHNPDWNFKSAYQYYSQGRDEHESNFRTVDFIFFGSTRFRPRRLLPVQHLRPPLPVEQHAAYPERGEKVLYPEHVPLMCEFLRMSAVEEDD